MSFSHMPAPELPLLHAGQGTDVDELLRINQAFESRVRELEGLNDDLRRDAELETRRH